jgi:DNA-binding transcriptional MerR regulator
VSTVSLRSRCVARRLLTSGQVGRELGLAPGTISRYARQGIITPALITAGGQYRFDIEQVREELRKLAEKRREQQRDE